MINLDVEYMLVATALTAPRLWHEVNFVKPDDFSDDLCGVIWRVLAERFAAGKSFDVNLVVEDIEHEEKKEIRGIIGGWIAALVSSDNGPDYARHIKDLSTRRKIILAADDIKKQAEDVNNNPDDVAGFGISKLNETTNDFCEFIQAHEIGSLIEADIDKPRECYQTGFKKLDNALAGGFYKGRFYGLAARMKSGKSLLMSSIAYNMTMNGCCRVLYLCLEMGSQESFQRVLSMHMGVNSLDFLDDEKRNAPWFRRRVSESVLAFKEKKNLVYRSRPRMSLDDLKSTIAKAGICGKYDGVIVDYLQLVEGKQKTQSSSEHYDNVAQTLAEAVKRYPIWILSAAQLNRDGNIRGSDGLLMACDASFSINKIEGGFYGDGTRIPDRAWLEMTSSRYTPFADIGTKDCPAYEIDYGSGPRFIELR
jgi:replicative DNA helicase